MTTLAAKLLLAPALIAAATLVTRRHGHRMGALLATLPAAAGPILLVVALQQGESFAADAASGALLGVVALNVFIVVYCRAAPRVAWPLALLAGWIGYLVSAALLGLIDVDAGIELALAWTANLATLALLPRLAESPSARPASEPPRWDIALRAAAAIGLIVAITGLAERLGPEWTGLLTPFPIIATVLAAFTHAQDGAFAATAMMRAFVVGLFAFAVFFFVLIVSLVELGSARAFTLAVAATVGTQLVALLATGWVERRQIDG